MEKDPGRVTFEDLRKRAGDPSVPIYEKLGFTDSAHEDSVDDIFEDFRSKLPALNREGIKILDIGCGCGELVKRLIRNAEVLNQDLFLIDSQEALDLIQPSSRVTKFAGKFPQEQSDLIRDFSGRFDIVIAYSVIMVVALEDNFFNFIDEAVRLLNPEGGRFLLGDIPNRSKRRRFFTTPEGIQTHRDYTHDPTAIPKIDLEEFDTGKLDDAMIFAILARYRNSGFETYLLPQLPTLPFANRREDILIERRK